MSHQIRASRASMKTWVRIPSTHIESRVWPHTCLSPQSCKGQRQKHTGASSSPAQLWFSARQCQRNDAERVIEEGIYNLFWCRHAHARTYALTHMLKIGRRMLWPYISEPDNSHLTQGPGFGYSAPRHWKHTAAKWIKTFFKKNLLYLYYMFILECVEMTLTVSSLINARIVHALLGFPTFPQWAHIITNTISIVLSLF